MKRQQCATCRRGVMWLPLAATGRHYPFDPEQQPLALVPPGDAYVFQRGIGLRPAVDVTNPPQYVIRHHRCEWRPHEPKHWSTA